MEDQLAERPAPLLFIADRHRYLNTAAELGGTSHILWRERIFDPCEGVGVPTLGRLQGLLQTPPTPVHIDHQADVRAQRIACDPHAFSLCGRTTRAERHLHHTKAARSEAAHLLSQVLQAPTWVRIAPHDEDGHLALAASQ
jgi:hypothetical protein